MNKQDTHTQISYPVGNHIEDNIPTLISSAMLVELNVSKWDARKLDKEASDEVTHTNNAHVGMANVHKKLLGHCEEHITLKRHIANARNIHYGMTLPWSKSGLQLVPTSYYFEYVKTMSEQENTYNELRDSFFDAYEQAIVDAKDMLGDLFKPENYPSLEDIRRKFSWTLTTMPLPNSGDFRIDLPQQAIEEVKEQYTNFYDDQLGKSMMVAVNRVYDALARMSERLDYKDDEDKKTFRDSLVTNLADIVDLLDHFNLNNNQEMKDMKKSLNKILSGVSADALREDSGLRHETKKAVDEAIKALPSLDI